MRQHVVAAQDFLVGVEVELPVTLEVWIRSDFLLQRSGRYADTQAVGLFLHQLLLDQQVERLLAQVRPFERLDGVAAVHLLVKVTELSRLFVDLVAQDLLPIDSGDWVDAAEKAGSKTEKSHEKRKNAADHPRGPRVLMSAHPIKHGSRS